MAELVVRIVAEASGSVKVLVEVVGPVKAVKPLLVPPLAAPRIPLTSAVARSTDVEVEPEPTNRLEVRVSLTLASVKAVPFQTPVPIVPRVVMLVEPPQVDKAVFSTLDSPTLLLASEVIQAGSAYEPVVRTMLAVVTPLTAVAVSVPPLMVPPDKVAPLMVEVHKKAPVALVTVQPVEPEPPPSRMSPVLMPPIETVLAPLPSIVRAPVPEIAVPETLRELTAVALRVPPDSVPPLMVAPLIVELVAIVVIPLKAPAVETSKAELSSWKVPAPVKAKLVPLYVKLAVEVRLSPSVR